MHEKQKLSGASADKIHKRRANTARASASSLIICGVYFAVIAKDSLHIFRFFKFMLFGVRDLDPNSIVIVLMESTYTR